MKKEFNSLDHLEISFVIKDEFSEDFYNGVRSDALKELFELLDIFDADVLCIADVLKGVRGDKKSVFANAITDEVLDVAKGLVQVTLLDDRNVKALLENLNAYGAFEGIVEDVKLSVGAMTVGMMDDSTGKPNFKSPPFFHEKILKK